MSATKATIAASGSGDTAEAPILAGWAGSRRSPVRTARAA
jgi:hypothetical protein